MSALGNYIHHSNKGYDQFGVSPTGLAKTYNAEAFNKIFKTRIKSVPDINPEVIKELKKRLKYESDNEDQAEQGRLRTRKQKIIDQLAEDMLNNYGEKVLNRYIGSTAYAYGNTDMAPSIENMSKLINLKKEIDTEIAYFISCWNSKIPVNPQLIQSLLSNLLEGSTNDPLDINSLKNKIEMSQFTNDGWKAYSLAIGDFGEKFVAAADDTINQLTDKEIDSALNKINSTKNMIVGKERTKIEMSNELFSKEYVAGTTMNTIIQGGKTQDKVDVNITVNEIPLAASVKYYSDQKVTIQSDLNLLTTLAYLNNTIEDFGNHWINMHAVIPKYTKSNMINDADNALMLEIAYEALAAGNPFKKNAAIANTFVYLNRKTGDIKVYTINSILTYFYNNNFSGLSISPNIRNLNFRKENSFKGTKNSIITAQDRISTLMQAIHSKNLHVSMLMDNIKI